MFQKIILALVIYIGMALNISINLNVSHATAGPMEISGVYYQKIVHMKDVIADILPPPGYLIESYLISLQMIDAVESKASKKTLDDLVTYGDLLANGRSDKGQAAGYFERVEFWVKDLDDKNPVNLGLRELMTKKAVTPAKKFFDIRDKKLIPALNAGNIAEAQKIARTELRPAYDEHRKVIDQIVADSTKEFLAAEKSAMDRIAKGEKSSDLKIKGKSYNQIIRMKDLIADVLPPPAYAIESLLVAMEMIDELDSQNGKPSDRLNKLIETGRLLKDGNSGKGETAGYVERVEYWKKNLSDKTLPEKKTKDLMTVTSVTPAMKFYAVRDEKLVPALKAGKVAEAKTILRNELTPLYNEHRKAIDELVARANKVYTQLEAEVAQQLVNH
ncbi:MAG: hypothetical protein SGJ18_12990 [Pseudomonadota bacterium]|nr:hypothetical protein [Pseudomonadota bacterium]